MGIQVVAAPLTSDFLTRAINPFGFEEKMSGGAGVIDTVNTWVATVAGTGTVGPGDNGRLEIDTNAGAGSSAGICLLRPLTCFSTELGTQRSNFQKFIFETNMTIINVANIDQATFVVGFKGGNAAGAATARGNLCGFGLDGAGNIEAIWAGNTAATGITPGTGAHVYRIEVTSGECQYFIDGVLVAELTPGNHLNFLNIFVGNNAAAQGYIMLWHTRFWFVPK